MNDPAPSGWTLFGLTWWQVVLCALPLPLVVFHNLFGILLGLGGCAANVVAAKSRNHPVAKAATMIVVVLGVWGLEIGAQIMIRTLFTTP